MAAVIFARVGWMKFYSGSQEGDERPVGGGKYNRKAVGSELFNFKINKDRVYGFFQPGRKSHAIRLERVVPSADDELSGVLIVFIARNSGSGGQQIVGWYRNATLYRQMQPSDSSERVHKGESFGYICEAKAHDACLLPTRMRNFSVPGGRSGFGQSNVCYPLDAEGSPKKASWMLKAIAFVNAYEGQNLLEDAAAEASSEIEELLERTVEQAAGFELNPKVRKAIEDFAMAWAKRHFGKSGLGYVVEDRSKHESYDLFCTMGSKQLFVEVKGTRSPGNSVILTRREVEHVRQHPLESALFVVHSVKIDGSRRPKVSGGDYILLKPWAVTDSALRPQAYVFKLPGNSNGSV